MSEEIEIAKPATDPMIVMLERVLINPEVPVERISAAMDLFERQQNKVAEQEFNKAFAAAMAEMPDIPQSGLNKHTKVKYSTLDDLIKTTRPILSRHGLSLNWEQGVSNNLISMTAVVRHALGHKITSTQSGAPDSGKGMNALQGGGSAETYLKRYSGFAILGLSSGDESDDDGQSANINTVSPEQFVILRNLISETNSNESKFLVAYGVTGSLQQFPANRFEAARAQLQRKKEAN